MKTPSETFQRMMTIVGRADPLATTHDDVLRYLHASSKTCKPQTLDQYAGQIRLWGERLKLSRAQDPMWPLLRRGFRAQATPRQHANPMTVDIFRQILASTDLEIGLAGTLAFLTGSRLDEVFRYRNEMITIATTSMLSQKMKNLVKNHFFVAISTGRESKSAAADPDDLRFVDIAVLDKRQLAYLKTLQKQGTSTSTIFTRRHQLTAELKKHHMTDHSFKAGTALILTEMVRDELIPQETIPLMLKHKSTVDPIQSVTSGYLGVTGRINMLQSKGTFDAAVHLRRIIFQDI